MVAFVSRSAAVAGTLTYVANSDNRHVTPGTLLAVVDASTSNAKVTEAESNVKQAEAQFDQSRAQVAAAEAQRDQENHFNNGFRLTDGGRTWIGSDGGTEPNNFYDAAIDYGIPDYRETEHTVPTLKSATAEAGRPEAFRVVAGFPVCVTDDPDSARERAATIFAVYGQLPSYRAMLDREGLSGPADIAMVGDEKTVQSAIERVAESGATDFLAAEFGATDTEISRTRELLRNLL